MSFKKRLRYNPLKSSIKKKGVALLLAVTSLILMVYVASEVTKDSSIEYVVNLQEVNRLKAYYAARNSAQVAMLRIKIFQQLNGMNIPAAFAQDLDQIWKFPFSWPLPIPTSSIAGDGTDGIDYKPPLFDGQYEHFITDEGSKIDINDLASPSKTLQDVTTNQLLNFFENKIETDEAFRNEYQNYNFKELINRIADWMTSVNTSKNGGDKNSAFQGLNAESNRDYPPNRGFRTLDELRLVPGLTPDLFSLLEPQITIYGMKAINPNVASGLVLKSLDKNLTEEAIKNALERREDPDKGGPFKGDTSEACRTDFKNYVEGFGLKVSPEFDKIPFICNKITNFKIEATGRSGGGKGAVQKKIIAIVMDINSAGNSIKNFLAEEKKAQQGQSQGSSQNNQNQQQQNQAGPSSGNKEPLPKGPPRIVYWNET